MADLERRETDVVTASDAEALSSAPTRNSSHTNFQALSSSVDASAVASRLDTLLDNNLLRVLSIRRSIDAAAEAPPPPFRQPLQPTVTLLEAPQPKAPSPPAAPTAYLPSWGTPSWHARGWGADPLGPSPAVALAPLSPLLRCASPTPRPPLPIDLGTRAAGPPPC